MNADIQRPKKPQRRNNRTNRRFLNALERRATHLSERLQLYDDVGGNVSRTVHERDALRWAVEVCREWMAIDPLIDYDWSDSEFTERASVDEVRALVGRTGTLGEQRVAVVDATLILPDDFRDRLTVRLVLQTLEEPEAVLGYDDMEFALDD